MKIRLSILMCLLCLVVGKVGAANWKSDAPSANQTYYLYNVGAGSFISMSNGKPIVATAGNAKLFTWTGKDFKYENQYYIYQSGGDYGFLQNNNTDVGSGASTTSMASYGNSYVWKTTTYGNGYQIYSNHKYESYWSFGTKYRHASEHDRYMTYSSSGYVCSQNSSEYNTNNGTWFFVPESQKDKFVQYINAWNNLNGYYEANKDFGQVTEIETEIAKVTTYQNVDENTKKLIELYNSYVPQGSTFKNPISTVDMADPAVILADDGYYYVYCSEHHAGEGISVYQSADMINWNKVTNVFPSSNRPSQLGYTFLWAPEIVKIENKYVLYIANAAWGNESETQICAATSDKPYGPFEFKSILFSANGANNTVNAGVKNCIDPYVLIDGDKKYMVWGSWHGVWYWELAANGLSVTGSKNQIATTGALAGDWEDIEAPMVTKHGGYYYLICSKGTTAGTDDASNINYRMVVARGTSLGGTFEVDNGNAYHYNNTMYGILSSNDFVLGPGHCSRIITDKNGCEWIFYHGYAKDASGNWNINNGRVLFASKVWWGYWNEKWPGILPPAESQSLIVPSVDAPINYYTRSDLQVDGYYTLCLPYASKSTDGATFYEIAGKKTVNGEITGIYVNECQTPLVAGRPYIFKASKETITVYYDGVPYVGNSCTYKGLVGNLNSQNITVPVDMYVFNSPNTIAKVETTDLTDKAKVRALIKENRAYLDLSQVSEYVEGSTVPGAKTMYFGFDGSETTTSIDGITSTTKAETAVYNIMGQRVGADAKGLLIKNGKKYLVK